MRKTTKPIHKHTLNLYEGDYEILQQCFPKVGGAAVIRDIIRAFILKNNLELEIPQNMQTPTLGELV